MKAFRLVDLFIFSQVYVALPITSLLFVTSWTLSISEPDVTLIAFVYCASLFIYSFHRWYGLRRVHPDSATLRHRWASDNKTILQVVMVLAVLGGGYFGLQLHKNLILALVPCGGVALAYSLPLLPVGKRWFRLRDIPGLKIFLITAVVSWVTVILPLLHIDPNLDWTSASLWELYLSRMGFIFAITVPFDIRDMDHDRRDNLKTLPLLFGRERAKWLAMIGLMVFALFTMMLQPDMKVQVALILSGLISGLVIAGAHEKRSEYYFSLLTEGTMVLQFLLVALAIWL